MANKVDKKSTIKLGLIGPGEWGKNYIKTINALENIELVSVLRRRKSKFLEVNKNYLTFTDFDKFISYKKLDGVIIASPPHTHSEIASKLIRKNIPIIIEKPSFTSIKEAHNLLDLAKKKSSIILIDHIFLYHPSFRLLSDLLKENNDIRTINCTGGNKGPYRSDISPLWDWGPHDIAMCLAIIKSNPIKINAKKIPSQSFNQENIENIKINLIFKNEITANILIGNNFPCKQRTFIVKKDKEIITFNPNIKNKLVVKNLSTNIIKEIKIKNSDENFNKLPLNLLLEEFHHLIIEGRSNLEDLKLGVEVTNILQKIEKIIVS